MAFLRSLATEFDNLVVKLENQIDKITIEDLHARVYREEVRQGSNDGLDNKLLSAYRKSQHHTQRSLKQIKCYYSKKSGHIKKYCW